MKTASKANSSGVYIRLGVKKIKKRYNKKIHGSKVGLHRVMVGIKIETNIGKQVWPTF